MILETERLILCPWEEKDANDLFQVIQRLVRLHVGLYIPMLKTVGRL